MSKARFAGAVNCMDGRVQEPVIRYLKERYGVDYVDMITEPGPDGILAAGNDPAKLSSVEARVRISVTKHRSEVIAVVGHFDCAGNPVAEAAHLEQIGKAVRWLRSLDLGIAAVGLWVGEDWRVRPAADVSAH